MIHCEHCGDPFPVEPASVGGIVNCPRCGRATSVPGLSDPLWRLIQAGVVGLAAGAFALGWIQSSPLHGAAAGAAVLALGWLATRAL